MFESNINYLYIDQKYFFKKNKKNKKNKKYKKQ